MGALHHLALHPPPPAMNLAHTTPNYITEGNNLQSDSVKSCIRYVNVTGYSFSTLRGFLYENYNLYNNFIAVIFICKLAPDRLTD